MHPNLVCRALAAIEPETTTIEQFQNAAGIASKAVVKSLLEFLSINGVGKVSNKAILFSNSDRLKAAVLCLKISGCDIEQVSRQLSWKNFEDLASEVLGSFGYRTRTNVRLVKPRMEIDVVGINSGLALLVDCKHWKRTNLSSISAFSRKQAARAQRLVMLSREIRLAVPAILTLHAESVRFVDGIPVVPIVQFRSFVMDVQAFLPEISVVVKV